ncbi:hypothetical protein AB0L75_29725 [Streptomyces sp. NPDC052101]|uniref:hypothetical protein n=1 Tax=Streptomyces sp. NPDC052101 TaxID=3155763 RepID=UPI003420AEEC
MHKFHKTAVLIAALTSLGFVSAGAAQAHGGQGGGGHNGSRFSALQSTTCRSHDLNLDVLGAVGLLNGLLGNGLNGEGDAGAQDTHLGSTMGCNNSVGK